MHIECGIYDQEEIISVVKKLQLDAVLTIATDQAMVSVAQIANECGLPRTAQQPPNATNKELMSSRFEEFHVPTTKRVALTKELDNPPLDAMLH